MGLEVECWIPSLHVLAHLLLSFSHFLPCMHSLNCDAPPPLPPWHALTRLSLASSTSLALQEPLTRLRSWPWPRPQPQPTPPLAVSPAPPWTLVQPLSQPPLSAQRQSMQRGTQAPRVLRVSSSCTRAGGSAGHAAGRAASSDLMRLSVHSQPALKTSAARHTTQRVHMGPCAARPSQHVFIHLPPCSSVSCTRAGGSVACSCRCS